MNKAIIKNIKKSMFKNINNHMILETQNKNQRYRIRKVPRTGFEPVSQPSFGPIKIGDLERAEYLTGLYYRGVSLAEVWPFKKISLLFLDGKIIDNCSDSSQKHQNKNPGNSFSIRKTFSLRAVDNHKNPENKRKNNKRKEQDKKKHQQNNNRHTHTLLHLE